MRGGFPYEKDEFDPFVGNVNSFWPRNQIFNSLTAAENARRSKSPFVPRHVYVVRNALDLRRFSTVPVLNGRRIRILGIGSLVPVKRWDQVLRAAGALKGRGLDYLVHIAGDGPLRGVLTRQNQDLGLTGQVEFVGYNDNIPELIANAIFLVHTSESEGCPNVVMEAMACGRPVVATNVGDVPYLVEDGKTGFVVNFGDNAALVDCMARLIVDRELCQRMGKLARTKAEREFGLDLLAANTLAAYQAAGWAG
jgi:glycosyltransferase involved in cell wall biosynthesis